MGSPSVLGVGRESHRAHEWRRLGLYAAVAWGFAGSYWGALLAVEPAIFAYRECAKGQTAEPGACQANFHRDWSHYSGNRLSYAALIGLAPIPLVSVLAFGLAQRRHRKQSPRPGMLDIRAAQLQAMKTPVTPGSARHPL